VQDRKNALLLQPVGAELSQETLATVQYALLRGVETTFQLEEGEILAEPMPTRDARSGVLFYEATEGGAGVLTRLVAEPDRLAQVALVALRILHFDAKDAASLPEDPSKLTDVPGTSCVAACYRCLMSYYNQPDHERLDRRNADARTMLLRLARSTTAIVAPVTRASSRPSVPPAASTALTRWVEQARAAALPHQDAEPYVDGDTTIPFIWRAHYAAAVLEGTPASVTSKLEDKGFEVHVFTLDESTWPESFLKLRAALGRAS